MTSSVAGGEVLWRPSPDVVVRSQLNRFLRYVRDTRGVAIDDGDYFALHSWSIEQLEEFWQALAAFYEVEFAKPAATALESRRMPGARWFPGATLSYVDHVFRDRDETGVAVVSLVEGGEPAELTWAELRDRTARLAAALVEFGVGKGDRVVGYVPNRPDAICAFLATASLGAVWSSCSPDFGPQAVTDRFAQIEPKVLFAACGYSYGGKQFDRRDAVSSLVGALPSLSATVVLPSASGDLAGMPHEHRLADLLTGPAPPPLSPVAVPFEHPLWILYSSGTTGLPKAIVHGHGGVLLEHLKWVGLHVDAQPDDRIFWLTTTGWMMWNFVVSTLLAGATAVLYEGNPGYPSLDALWDLAEAADVTCFGAGASFYAACMKAGVAPREGRALENLRSIGSTGSPLLPEVYDWIYEHLGPDIWLFSCSGGTDVCSAFVGGTPLLPVRRGELQAPALGVDAQAWDESGRRLDAGVGELVVTKPMPSMPIYLWGDGDGMRLEESYFSMYPGVWRHGDWIEFMPSGGAVIHGRSDSTINRSGVRIGTAEIYRAVLTLPEVQDAVVVDIPREGAESWVPLFVTLSEGLELDDALRKQITTRIRELCSPRHVPNDVFQVPAIPRTLSGKVLEVPVKRLLMGAPVEQVASRDSLANPKALDWFAEFALDRQESNG